MGEGLQNFSFSMLILGGEEKTFWVVEQTKNLGKKSKPKLGLISKEKHNKNKTFLTLKITNCKKKRL